LVWVDGILRVWYHVVGQMGWACVKLLWIYGGLLRSFHLFLLFYFSFHDLGLMGFTTLVSHSWEIKVRHDNLFWVHGVSW